MPPNPLSCLAQWDEWGIRCTLEPKHTGPHYGISEHRIAYWGGGGPSTWTRV